MKNIFQPWLVKETNIENVVKMYSKLDDIPTTDIKPSNEMDVLPYDISDGVAIIDIEGIIINCANDFESDLGFVGCEQVKDLIASAINDTGVSAIILTIDSCGGTVTGVPELADYIVKARAIKPIVAYVDNECCSAAYWIAASCTAIYASKSANLGSIGVYMSCLDVSKMFENEGVKAVVIKAGTYKGAGIQGTSFSEEQIQYFQDQVNVIYNLFKSHIRSNRGNISDDIMQGQDFYGFQCVSNKLIDSVSDLENVCADAKKMSARR